MSLHLTCPDCGREFAPDEGLLPGEDCPSDDCPSHDDESDAICGTCNGSGEGMYDGSTCSRCGGSGEVSYISEKDMEEGAADHYWQMKQDMEYDRL